MLLGVHLIVRDEASSLAGCLDSIGDWADELVIVDTGSLDETRQMALSHGARVLETAWADDFAAARNTGIGQARTLWVLVMDADERLAEGTDMSVLRDMLLSSRQDAYRVVIESTIGGRTGQTLRHEAVRLFRADRGIRYAGAIHEQLVLAAADGELRDVDGPLSGLRFTHLGYEPDQLARKRTAERNGRILARLVAEQPDNSFYWYHMGVTLCQQSKAAEASAAFARARRLVPPDAPFRPALMLDSARALAAADEDEQAMKLLAGETERYGDYPDLLLLYGRLLERHGEWLEAKSAYRAAADAGEKGTGAYMTEAGAGTYQARTALAGLERRTGNRQLAAQLYEQALSERPGWPEALAGMAELLHELGGTDGDIAQKLLRYAGADTLPETDGGRYARIAAIAAALTGIGAYSSAIPLWRDRTASGGVAADGLLAEYPEWLVPFAACLIRTGQYTEAGAMLHRQGETNGLLAQEAAMDWALCRWMEGQRLPEEADYWLDAHALQLCRAAERRLLGHSDGEELADIGHGQGGALWEMIDRAVSHGLLRLAVRLSRRSVDDFAVALHRHGYTAAAADQLLRLMGTGELTASGLCALGEMLYDRQLYNESLSLYERASLYEPGDVRARLGAAAASLRLASQALQEREQDRDSAAWMAEDRKRLERAALRLEGLGWRTNRSGAQRRRMRSGGAAEADFLMYDRQE
ncbi:glycosyltransferase family 2 protein [Paenibacillus kobensis]|uniref:glycosyltransferase family 2 protein n=1 Tax=Paenibacillus kobensis TaxID=59841 RepID=UPI000FDAE8FC|nr:glycosyltransferase family 2 protein [Paenibacillus kobensis]